MLNQEQPEAQTLPIDKNDPQHSPRVTPQELSSAIAKIERRKAAEAKYRAETVPVAVAIQELRIDATSEEILAEVEAQRAIDAAPPTPQKQPQTNINVEGTPKRRRRFGWKTVIAAIVVFSIFHSAFNFGSTSNTNSDSDSKVTETLNDVRENHPVSCDNANLETLIKTGDLKHVTVKDGLDSDDMQWKVVKIGGHVYVRGFLLTRITQSALDLGPVTLYNDDSEASDASDDNDVKAELRTDQVHLVNVGGTGRQLTAKLRDVKLDDNAYVDWDDD